MAVIQYTGLVAGMQGKINGSVLSRGRAGQLIYKSPVQRKEPTNAQLSVRGAFSAIAAFWRALTPEEREDWITIADANPLPNRFGDPMTVSGYAYFQRMLSLGSPFLSPASLAPDLSADSVYEFSTVSAASDIELTDEGYQLTNVEALGTSLNDSAAANQWNLYISLPVPDFGLPYFKTWYLIGQGTFSPGLGSAAALNFDVASVLLSTGFRSFDGAKHLLKGICFIPDQGGVSVEQIWDVVPNWAPPVDFPEFEPSSLSEILYDISDFSYFWESAEQAEIVANFSLQTQWADPQPGLDPVGDGDWYPIVSTGIIDPFGAPMFMGTIPGGPYGWFTPWDVEAGVNYDPMTDNYAPVRARLIHIATGQEGPWVVAYIVIYPTG